MVEELNWFSLAPQCRLLLLPKLWLGEASVLFLMGDKSNVRKWVRTHKSS